MSSHQGKIRRTAAEMLGARAVGGADARATRRIQSRPGAGDQTPFGSLASSSLKVVTDDGIDLHVEIDEVDPGNDNGLTVVFVHGFTLNMNCWHFQRAAYRGLVRTVFYDQRSHGESARSSGENCTIEQLGRDLKRVIETTTEGPVVVVAHSMGGMSLIAMAAEFPELFGTKIIGTALIGTTAGGLDPGRILFPMLPLGSLGGKAIARLVRTLDRGHKGVDVARASGHRLAEVVIDRFAFGDEVPRSYAEFVFRMIDATSFEVVADFYPAFASLDHYDQLAALGQAPCLIIAGAVDRLTSVGHSRKLHARIPGSELYEVQGAGHMALLEKHDVVNAQLDDLFERSMHWAWGQTG